MYVCICVLMRGTADNGRLGTFINMGSQVIYASRLSSMVVVIWCGIEENPYNHGHGAREMAFHRKFLEL